MKYFHCHWAELRRFIYSQPDNRIAITASRQKYGWSLSGWSVTTEYPFLDHFFKNKKNGSDKLLSMTYGLGMKRYRRRYAPRLDCDGNKTNVKDRYDQLVEQHLFTDGFHVQGFKYVIEDYMVHYAFTSKNMMKAKLTYGELRNILRNYEKTTFNTAPAENVVDNVPD